MNDKSRLIRVLGVLALVGGITAVFLIIAFEKTGWGSPGTAVYQTYEVLNRRMAGALLLMTAGWLGMVLWLPKGYGRLTAVVAFISSLLMVVGVAAEFWLYTDLPYAEANMRSAAFSLFSLSSLALDLSLTVLGISLWRSRLWPRWSALILLLALPLDLVAFFGLDSIFLASTILALVMGINLNFTKQFPAQVRTDIP
jgi:hypothetical protein